jgi:pimeloyl-ACP methyl ester carboxylesterase
VALDLPGFATADPLPAGEGVIERMGDFAAAAAEHFGESGNAVVAGNSLGGAAALLAATRTDVGGVVAIAPAGFDLGQWIYRLENFWLLQTLLRMPPLVPGTLLRSIVGQVYRQLAICDQRAVSAEVVSRFASHHRDRSTVMRYLQTARLLLPELMQPLALEGIAAPVLIVWGSRDRMLPSRNAELVLEQIPHARVELIDRCGHCPQVERPQLTAKLLLRGP